MGLKKMWDDLPPLIRWAVLGLLCFFGYNFVKKVINGVGTAASNTASDVVAATMGISSGRAAELRAAADRCHMAFFNWKHLPFIGWFTLYAVEDEDVIIREMNGCNGSEEVRYLAQMFFEKFADYDPSKQITLKAAINRWLSASEIHQIQGSRFFYLP
jgi:hypothetical protein